MEYPIWQVEFVNHGLLIAVIAVIHVFVSHFAVGGGFFLVAAEAKAYREGSQAILDFTKRFTRFFLLLTTVFGGLSGVAIWLVISLASPAGTSLLVHSFVFALAAEWAFFLGEIVAILVYYYTFGRMGRASHLFVGVLYCVFAWLSLFTINGFLSFMETPGAWTGPADFWAGFFNPTFWPFLVLRTSLALILAGLFGLGASVREKDKRTRHKLTAWSALWVAVPVVVLLASAWWAYMALPWSQQAMILRRTQDIRPFFLGFLVAAPVILLGGLLFANRAPGLLARPVAGLLILLGLAQIGTFEWVRETGRRPFLVQGVMYSNSIRAADLAAMNERGALACARWAKHKTITPENELEAGRELYLLECKSCHGVRGPMLDLARTSAGVPGRGFEAMLTGQGKLSRYMPPFAGTEAEKKALARYLAETLAPTQNAQADTTR